MTNATYASVAEVCQAIAAGKLSAEEASPIIDLLKSGGGKLYCKVSPKGAVSVYGLQRMPVTLYLEQWERLLAFGETLKAFLTENEKTGAIKRKIRKAA